MQTGRSLLNYSLLQFWHTSKSWICLCFIKCVLKNFIIFMFGFFSACSLNCRVLSMLTAVHRHPWAPGCSSRHCSFGSCWRGSVWAPRSFMLDVRCLLSGVHYLLSLMLFCNLSSLIPDLGCVSCGIVFQIWHPEMAFLTSAKPLCPSSLSSLSVTNTDSCAPSVGPPLP